MWRLIFAFIVLGLATARPRRPGGGRPGGGGDDGPSGRPRDRDGAGGRPRGRVAPVSNLEGAFTQVETRLRAGAPPQGGTGTPSTPRSPGAQVQNAGQWSPPTTPRHHGHPFNAEYEAWIRRQTGGPNDGNEYLVQHNGEQAFFDGNEFQDRGGTQTEVLIDGKGRFEQFIDPQTGDFQRWWGDQKKTGLGGELLQAERQVRVADGRPVEWWCAERATADAFNDAFANNPNLRGRIVAVHKPMP